MAALYMAAVLLALVAAPSEARLLRAGGAAVAGRRATTSHPIENVIAMLKRLGSKADEEGKAEATTYEKFQHWGSRSQLVLEYTIGEERSTLESLADLISARKLTIETSETKLTAISAEIFQIAKADREALSLRGTEQGLYHTKDSSLSGTIRALGDAITLLTRSRTATSTDLIQRSIRNVMSLASIHLSVPQLGLLQKVVEEPRTTEPPQSATTTGTRPATSHVVEEPESTGITTTRPDLKAGGDYSEHVDTYAFKSDSVIELLKSLLQKFEADLVKTHEAETNAINAYELAKAARADLNEASVLSQRATELAKQDAERELIEAEASQLSTQSDLDADMGTLSTTKKACDEKAAEWEERSKIRTAEAEAIQTAITVLAKVTGVRTSPPENPGMPVSPVTDVMNPSFFQMPGSPDVKQALELLRQEARVSHSQAISQLAAALAAHAEGPFDQVMNSIEKMVFRLQNEQREEDDHKNWCDLEVKKTSASIDDKTDKLSELSANIEVAQSRAVRLGDDITAANSMVSTITTHVKDATEIRKTGREENNLAIKDSDDAQTAVTQAIAVLTTFYKSSGSIEKQDWESFLQRHRIPMGLVPAPATWEGRYVSVENPRGGTSVDDWGVINILKDISADFSRMETDTIAQEESDQNAYEQDMKSCKIEKARRFEESEGKSQERKRVVDRQTSLESTHKQVTHQKEATVQYQDDLQPACVTGASTYENRKSARATEITALKSAKSHLHDAFKNI